ncbi:MAG: DUF4177 domain-containing protein [Planctomycetaceae bacterium]|nr:DUF4177 domain-containing protein [Planctomycetaceae bacterium]
MIWEYKTVKLRTTGFTGGKLDELQLDATLNALGRDGWELAAALDTNEAGGNSRDVVVILKRPQAG